MIKNLLTIPNLFTPNDHKRRQALNTLLILLIAAVVFAMMNIFANPDVRSIDPASYYSLLMLFLVVLIFRMGITLTDSAIRDARRQTANLKVILNNIADGVLMLDQQGNFLSANPALLRMIPEDELRKMSFKPFEKTIRWKRKIFAVTATPVPEAGKVVIFRDQTRCHEIEQARDALLATVSHEFRTPLTVVMNYLELLQILTKMGKIDCKTFSEHLARALENSRRLQRLVANILDQAQIQAGALELKERRFELSGLLEKSRQLLDISLKEKNLAYELSIAPDVPAEITGDPERLQQVLVNLIGNAVKFTSRGNIKVRVFMPMKEKLSIEVADTGPGIPDEQLPDIFETFRRASNYAQRQHQGAGLGLSIVREIMTCMGGDVSVNSALGIGSTFTVSLPLTSAMRR